MDESIPDDVIRLMERIEDYEQLEVLLLLYEHRERRWLPDAIAAQLNISRADAMPALEHVCKLQLADAVAEGADWSFRYRSGYPGADDTLRNLARAYDEQRLAIVKLMTAQSIERLRTTAIRTFADAFIVRRKKDG